MDKEDLKRLSVVAKDIKNLYAGMKETLEYELACETLRLIKVYKSLTAKK
jgi:hypothetical protein